VSSAGRIRTYNPPVNSEQISLSDQGKSQAERYPRDFLADFLPPELAALVEGLAREWSTLPEVERQRLLERMRGKQP
jgi:hypothetical protein